LIFLPINDTLGIIPLYEPDPASPLPVAMITDFITSDQTDSSPSEKQPIHRPRHLPSNWCQFLLQHLPFSWDTLKLLSREAKTPFDWVDNLLLHSSIKVFRLIGVQYFFVVCEFSPVVVGVCAIFLGFISFLTLPRFLSRYTPESLVFISTLGTITAFTALSVAGMLVCFSS
jgi:hypothetical protein